MGRVQGREEWSLGCTGDKIGWGCGWRQTEDEFGLEKYYGPIQSQSKQTVATSILM